MREKHKQIIVLFLVNILVCVTTQLVILKINRRQKIKTATEWHVSMALKTSKVKTEYWKEFSDKLNDNDIHKICYDNNN